MQLSKNFSISEFNRLGLSLSESEVENFKCIASNLQSIRDFVGKPITVTSGKRSIQKNNGIGGSKTSQHLFGEAADFVIDGVDSHALDDVFNMIYLGKIKLPCSCSQVIRESRTKNDGTKSEWIHIGIKTDRWIEAQKQSLNSAISRKDTIAQSKFSKRLTSCEFLTSPDGVEFNLVGYKLFGDFGNG